MFFCRPEILCSFGFVKTTGPNTKNKVYFCVFFNPHIQSEACLPSERSEEQNQPPAWAERGSWCFLLLWGPVKVQTSGSCREDVPVTGGRSLEGTGSSWGGGQRTAACPPSEDTGAGWGRIWGWLQLMVLVLVLFAGLWAAPCHQPDEALPLWSDMTSTQGPARSGGPCSRTSTHENVWMNPANTHGPFHSIHLQQTYRHVVQNQNNAWVQRIQTELLYLHLLPSHRHHQERWTLIRLLVSDPNISGTSRDFSQTSRK